MIELAHNMVTMTYLVACDYVIVPLHLAKNTSTHGYEDVIDRCREAREEYGNKPYLLFYFVWKFIYIRFIRYLFLEIF